MSLQRVRACACVCVFCACACACAYVCACLCAFARVCMCMCVCALVCMCVCLAAPQTLGWCAWRCAGSGFAEAGVKLCCCCCSLSSKRTGQVRALCPSWLQCLNTASTQCLASTCTARPVLHEHSLSQHGLQSQRVLS